MARTPVQAAGGIVLRQAKPPLIAVVRLRKRNEWVLPKGKLDDGETPREAAEREVNEETGHDVTVHEFLGTLVYESSGRSKIVHYWRMQADGEQVYELMTDIREVDWLPLEVALVRLSRASERTFLEHVGPVAVASALADLAKRKAKAAGATKSAPATKPATTAKAAPTKAAPAKKRRTAPVQPPPAASMPVSMQPAVEVQFAAPVPAPIEQPPAMPDMSEFVASEPADGTPMFETPESLPPVEAPEPMTIEPADPIQSAETLEPVAVPEQVDPPAVPAVVAEANSALPASSEAADVPETEANESRRKTLAEKLRNWLGSVA
jgi:8-oxo-dGTP diphosphatase